MNTEWDRAIAAFTQAMDSHHLGRAAGQEARNEVLGAGLQAALDSGLLATQQQEAFVAGVQWCIQFGKPTIPLDVYAARITGVREVPLGGDARAEAARRYPA